MNEAERSREQPAANSSVTTISCWRVLPYDPRASPAAPFTAEFLPPNQGSGRFDIPDLTPVWYFAESPVHAVAEVLQGLRNQRLDDADLVRFGHRLALTAVTLNISAQNQQHSILPDLCDPNVLSRHGIRPDTLASSDFAQTQAVARQLFLKKSRGFRWWSALFGDWHTVVIFQTRLRARSIRFDTPEPLSLRSASVLEAAQRLAIQIAIKT